MKYVAGIFAGALLTTAAFAQPFQAPRASSVGDAYVYTTTLTGGSTDLKFSLPTPPNGTYLMSLKANFQQVGKRSAPIADSCWITRNGDIVAQSTTADLGAYYIGVSAQSVITVKKGVKLGATCGSAKTPWLFANLPVTVSLVRLGTETKGNLSIVEAPASQTKTQGGGIPR